MPACLRIARSVPSGMSPGWLGMVVYPIQRRVEPDLVRARGLAVEFQAELLQPLEDVPIPKARQRAHQVATMSG